MPQKASLSVRKSIHRICLFSVSKSLLVNYSVRLQNKSCLYHQDRCPGIPTPVRMTLCPPRLQIQTLWTGAILTGKMTFLRAKCLPKIIHTIEIVVLNIPTPVRMILCPPRLQLQTSWTWTILTGKITFGEQSP